jgi:hypothetical protein
LTSCIPHSYLNVLPFNRNCKTKVCCTDSCHIFRFIRLWLKSLIRSSFPNSEITNKNQFWLPHLWYFWIFIVHLNNWINIFRSFSEKINEITNKR